MKLYQLPPNTSVFPSDTGEMKVKSFTDTKAILVKSNKCESTYPLDTEVEMIDGKWRIKNKY